MTRSENKNLKVSAVKSGKYTIIEQIVRLVVQMIQLYVLGRLLAIEDYGLIMMMQTFTGFTAVFRDFGFSNASVQAASLTKQQSSNLFWLGVAVSLCLTALLAALAPVAAWTYGKQELLLLVLVGSISPIISGVAAQPVSLLKRDMLFGKLAVIRIVAALVSILVAIGMALLGWGAWALLCSSLSTGIVVAAGTWVATGFWPKRFKSGVGTRALINYGGHFTAGSVLAYFGRNIDNLLIGLFFGDTKLGLYSRAYALLMLPVVQVQSAIGQVNFATFSRLQDQRDKFANTAIRLLSIYLMLSSLIVLPMVCASEDLVVLILGQKWAPASKIFLYLTPIAWVQLAGSICSLTFQASGQIQKFTRWNIVNNILAFLGISAGLPWGVEGVALSYSVSGLLIRYPYLIYCVDTTGYFATKRFLQTAAFNALVAIPSLIAGVCVSTFSTSEWALIRLLQVSTTTTVVYFGVLLLTVQGRKSFEEVKELLTTMIKRTPSPAVDGGIG